MNITKIQNEIQELLKEDNKVNFEIISNVQYKIKLIKEELENINYAIHWTKFGVIKSFILSKNEIELATNILNKQNLPYTTIEEALLFRNKMERSSSNFTTQPLPSMKDHSFPKRDQWLKLYRQYCNLVQKKRNIENYSHLK